MLELILKQFQILEKPKFYKNWPRTVVKPKSRELENSTDYQKICNRNGSPWLISGDAQLALNMACVSLRLWENTVCSFKYFEQCIILQLLALFVLQPA